MYGVHAMVLFFIISYGASVTQEQQKVGCRDSETSNGRYKKANTKYTTHKGLYVDSYFLELPKTTLQVCFPDLVHCFRCTCMY